MAYLWRWFNELQTSTELVVTYQEILAWSQLTGASPTPGEVHFIRELSRLFLSIIHKH